MSYMALYRKWRPTTFEDVKGQDHIVQTLKIRSHPAVSVMRICFAEPEEQEKPVSRRYLPERSTVNTRWTEVPVGSARPVKISLPVRP